jgi:hypothetical protein
MVEVNVRMIVSSIILLTALVGSISGANAKFAGTVSVLGQDHMVCPKCGN